METYSIHIGQATWDRILHTGVVDIKDE
jgi:hypothetical protein